MDGPSETTTRSDDQGTSSPLTDQQRGHRPRPSSPSRARPTTTTTADAGLGLNEFSSLLEAAQRIANIPLGLGSGAWLDEEQHPDPVIRRASGTDEVVRRVPQALPRRYSGRPHIPGEDSGSDDDQDPQPFHIHPEPATMASQRRGGEIHYDRAAHEARQQLQRAAARLRQGRDPSEERHRRRDEVMARMRERARADHLSANTATATATAAASEHYATSGPSPVRDSFYDWAPEPQDTSHPQARSSSVRRWRPAERLQDYASSHARRPSGNESVDHTRTPSTTDMDNVQPWDRSLALPRLPTDLRDHNEIVDRVEQALQQYRASRALMTRHDNLAAQSHAPHPPVADPQADLSRSSPTNSAAQDVRDTLNSLLSRDARPAPRSEGIGEAIANRLGRNQVLRHRVHEHRHRFVSTLFDRDTDDLASGPLFGAPSDNRDPRDTLGTDRWRADTRRTLDKVRRAEARAKSKDLGQAKAALQYLAHLRQEHMDDVRAWTLASELRLHNQSLQETLQKDLPISLDQLPKPVFCSWLEPGMTWTGTQSAEHELQHAREPLDTRRSGILRRAAARRAREHQDPVDAATRENESFRARIRQGRDPLERVFVPNTGRDALSIARNSMQILEDAERNLGLMLESSERLLRDNERQAHEFEEQLARTREPLRQDDERLATLRSITRNELGDQPPQQESTKAEDRWNVRVTLHEVDWRKMTLTGTMTASHTPNLQPNGPEKLGDETSMDSFFTGEIVDFVNYGLDTTVPTGRDGRPVLASSSRRKLLQDDYKVGGPETDLTYWAGLGPFKERIERAFEEKLNEREQLARHSELDKLMADAPNTANAPTMSRRNTNDPDKIEPLPPATDETSELSLPTILSEDERYDVKMSTMHDLLTNTRWLNQNINAQGWILMRWKERCFVAPGTEPNPEPNRPWIPGRSNLDEADTAFGRGHLNYADLYRRRQDARANPRIYTTNAAERDEIRGNNNNNSNNNSSSNATDEAGGSEAPRQLTWTPSHSLSISGFYYVALHRVTGRIEALYYDCGSAPFQTLKMGPVTSGSHAQLAPGEGDAMDVDAQDSMAKDVPVMPGGLRTNFNVVQWR